jgi:Phage integrase, N-terminal SAM-like domain
MQDLDLAGYAVATRRHYVYSIAQFARFHGKSPANLGQPEVRQWVEHLRTREPKLGPQRLRQHFAALRFLYGKTLGRPEVTSFLSWPKDPRKTSVTRFCGATRDLRRCRKWHETSVTRILNFRSAVGKRSRALC